MRVGIGGVLLIVAAWCAGCASQPTPALTSAMAPGQAKLSISRADEGATLIAASVQIAVNGTHVADLASGQSYTGGVPPGMVTLTASQSMDMGHYTVQFKAAPGKTYAFLVSKRTERLVAGVLGGLAGMAIETAVSGEQSGAYKITAVQ
jgi:hypothetical protein